MIVQINPCLIMINEQNMFGEACLSYTALRHVLSYLSAPHLLKASLVCHMWHDLALLPRLVSINCDNKIQMHWIY